MACHAHLTHFNEYSKQLQTKLIVKTIIAVDRVMVLAVIHNQIELANIFYSKCAFNTYDIIMMSIIIRNYVMNLIEVPSS